MTSSGVVSQIPAKLNLSLKRRILQYSTGSKRTNLKSSPDWIFSIANWICVSASWSVLYSTCTIILWKLAKIILHWSYLNLFNRYLMFRVINLWINLCNKGSYKLEFFEEVSHLYTFDNKWSACSSSFAKSVTQWLANYLSTLKAAEHVTNSSRSVSNKSIKSFLFVDPIS